MLLADLSLARRVEAGEAVVGFESAQSLARIYPESGALALLVAGGCAAYVGAGSPFNQATGVGMNGPVTEAEFDGHGRLRGVHLQRQRTGERDQSRARKDFAPFEDDGLVGFEGHRSGSDTCRRDVHDADDAVDPDRLLRRELDLERRCRVPAGLRAEHVRLLIEREVQRGGRRADRRDVRGLWDAT